MFVGIIEILLAEIAKCNEHVSLYNDFVATLSVRSLLVSLHYNVPSCNQFLASSAVVLSAVVHVVVVFKRKVVVSITTTLSLFYSVKLKTYL